MLSCHEKVFLMDVCRLPWAYNVVSIVRSPRTSGCLGTGHISGTPLKKKRLIDFRHPTYFGNPRFNPRLNWREGIWGHQIKKVCWTISVKLKGTVSRDGFGFWWHVSLVLGLNTVEDGVIFEIFFRCSNDFKSHKVYFSRLMGVYVGLIMLAACFCHSR